jgi:RecB family exonuclease
MDRLDLSASGLAAGVLDFKTGKASRIRGGEEEHIQDLLYGYAMRNNAQFPTIQLVTFHYLTMNSEDESELINMRNLPTELFASEENGGLSSDELAELIAKTNLELDELLKSNLAMLAQAIIDGRFAPNPDSKSFTYCEVCSVIGKTKVKKISKTAKPQVQGVI